ncbi:PhzF family phenazine biosynthesis protein [Pseudomonas rhodesiae]|uniref:PhzF family phenazine biosynthesis protein n=1 Tax=Pseudomonas rhodesiae TaxID=76760 RepID=UPI00241E6B24|nr:PhzF family phenazine biosynthesis protein [Pseudomonas rhodesiae]
MHSVSFKQVDVFTFERYKGNPVAVVLDAKGLSDAEMQQIANWTNLSETTFVLPKTQEQADYRVRIFTPGSELPFAGHPTIGTAHALIEAGAIVPTDGVVVQECGAGLVRLDVTIDEAGKQLISFELPQSEVRAI